jgi:hypothetical protein
MPLKYKVKSQAEVPAELQAHYVERDGAWVLDAEGVVEKAKLDEFRATNVSLLKERDDLIQRFEGIDPDEVRKLTEEKRKLEEQQQLKAGEVEKVYENRLKTARTDWERQFNGVVAERDTLKTTLARLQIEDAAVADATRRGLRSSALEDLKARALKNFALVDGVPRALEADGRTARVGKDGVTPLGIADWVEALVSEAPHLFEANVGGGAAGDNSGGVANGSARNPFRKETWNLTEQMKLQKSNPQLAARLKAAA